VKKSDVPKLSYVKGLDGIRGIGIIAVILYHAGVPGSGGNLLAVDVFFVLSGYLITSLLLTNWEKAHTISFGSFYSRRARRLFPALFSMIVIVLAAEAIWGNRGALNQIGGAALATLFYSANWYYIFTHNGYFGMTALQTPFKATWTLAIEEQYYIIWPLIVFLVLRKAKSYRPLLFVSIAGALMSAVAMPIVYGSGHENLAYYSTETRIQALMIGSAAAIFLKYGNNLSRFVKSRLAYAYGFIGLIGVCIIISQAAGPAPFLFRGGFTLSEILDLGFITSCAVFPEGLISRFFSFEPFVALGKISYAMYIWMLPVMQFMTEESTHLSGAWLQLARILAIIAISTASYFVVENPIRTGKRIKNKTPFLLTPTAVLSAIALVLTVDQLGAPPAVPAQSVMETHYSHTISVFLAGDSMPYTLGVGLTQREKEFGVKIEDEAVLGCGALVTGWIDPDGIKGPQTGGYPVPCDKIYPRYKRLMAELRPDVTVLLIGFWDSMSRSFNDGKTWLSLGNPILDDKLISAIKYLTSILHEYNTPVVYLTMPYTDLAPQPNGEPVPQNNPKLINLFNSILRKVAKEEGSYVTVIDLNKKVDPNNRYAEYIDGVQIRSSDGLHFTTPPRWPDPNYPDGGWWLAPWLLPKLWQVGNPHYMLTH